MTDLTDVVFIDLETTGLDPYRHAIWEVGIVSTTAGDPDAKRTERAWQLELSPHMLAQADPEALELGGFYNRRSVPEDRYTPADIAALLYTLLDGAYIGGANPDFDARFLERLFRRWMPGRDSRPWNHHLLDVEAYAAGRLGWPVPKSLSHTCHSLGIERVGAHTALEDALTAEKVYRWVRGHASTPVPVDVVF